MPVTGGGVSGPHRQGRPEGHRLARGDDGQATRTLRGGERPRDRAGGLDQGVRRAEALSDEPALEFPSAIEDHVVPEFQLGVPHVPTRNLGLPARITNADSSIPDGCSLLWAAIAEAHDELSVTTATSSSGRRYRAGSDGAGSPLSP